MYQQIKNLAEEALRLQNKNFMDETFKKIIAICDDAPAPFNPEKIVLEDLMRGNVALIDGEFVKIVRTGMPSGEFDLQDATLTLSTGSGYERVTYGEAKQFDTEAELIASIQGVPSPVFPLNDAQPVFHDYHSPSDNPAVLDEQPQSVLGERNAEADAIVTAAAVDAKPEEPLYVFGEVTKEGDLMLDDAAIFVTDSAIHVDTKPAEPPFAAPADPAGAELAEIEEMMSAAMTKPFEAPPREAAEALNKLASKKARGAK